MWDQKLVENVDTKITEFQSRPLVSYYEGRYLKVHKNGT